MNNLSSFQLLLVDDDAQIRTGLEQIIRSHFPESELDIISCENGLTALQILQQEPVDLLITDIKMPFCSGIEVLKTINDQKIDCYSIVLSGYDDFNLVRDAMRFGAKDYLLKPIDEDILIHTITEAKAQLNLPKKQYLNIASASTVLKMQKLIENCFADSSHLSPELKTFMEEHQITKHTSCLLCYIDIKRALYSNHFTMFQFLANRLATYLSNLPEDLSRQINTVYGGIDTFWIVILFSRQNSLPPSELLEPFLCILKQDHLKYSYTKVWYPFSDIVAADVSCKKDFESYYYDLPPRRINNTDSAASFVYSILTRNPAFIPIISTEKFTDYDLFEHIEKSESISILQKKLYISISHLIETILHSMKDKDNYIIQKAKEYIHNNYPDNISLNDVAAHVFLNGNYFSTLFSSKTGITFRNYLRNYRIEKLKNYLVQHT